MRILLQTWYNNCVKQWKTVCFGRLRQKLDNCNQKGGYFMKKFFSVLLTVLTAAVLAFSLTACEKPSEGLDYELNENQNAYYVTGLGTCADTNIVIPSEY